MSKDTQEVKKYTKKATARILSEVLKINPKASKLMSLDQAYVFLMTHWDMDMSVSMGCDCVTECVLNREWDMDENKPTWKFEKEVWDDKNGDWDWTTIYKTVLEDIIKKKMYKKPKLGKRAQKKLDEFIAQKKETETNEIKEEPKSTPTKTVSLEDLRKTRDRIYMKIYTMKKNNIKADTRELDEELDKIKMQIKEFNKKLA